MIYRTGLWVMLIATLTNTRVCAQGGAFRGIRDFVVSVEGPANTLLQADTTALRVTAELELRKAGLRVVDRGNTRGDSTGIVSIMTFGMVLRTIGQNEAGVVWHSVIALARRALPMPLPPSLRSENITYALVWVSRAAMSTRETRAEGEKALRDQIGGQVQELANELLKNSR